MTYSEMSESGCDVHRWEGVSCTRTSEMPRFDGIISSIDLTRIVDINRFRGSEPNRVVGATFLDKNIVLLTVSRSLNSCESSSLVVVSAESGCDATAEKRVEVSSS